MDSKRSQDVHKAGCRLSLKSHLLKGTGKTYLGKWTKNASMYLEHFKPVHITVGIIVSI